MIGSFLVIKTIKKSVMSIGIKGLIGVASAGVLVGLLVAPEKGKTLRKKIMNGSDEFSDIIKVHVEKGREKIDELKLKGKELLSATELKIKKLKQSLS